MKGEWIETRSPPRAQKAPSTSGDLYPEYDIPGSFTSIDLQLERRSLLSRKRSKLAGCHGLGIGYFQGVINSGR
ncbi:hypothetical protein CBD41_01475 [bacterium TMED181]|nr:hypothetical protein [Planctomycetota bacterium]OUW47133.1 MAG: hypothetical protein CBD41_01475 [bacterium TMED181]